MKSAQQELLFKHTTMVHYLMERSLTPQSKRIKSSRLKLELVKLSKDGMKALFNLREDRRQLLFAHLNMLMVPLGILRSFHKTQLSSLMLSSLTSQFQQEPVISYWSTPDLVIQSFARQDKLLLELKLKLANKWNRFFLKLWKTWTNSQDTLKISVNAVLLKMVAT